MAGIYLEGLNWAIHEHPQYHKKIIKIDNGDGTFKLKTVLDFISYEKAMFALTEHDRLAETPEEVALIESFRQRIIHQHFREKEKS
jgi:hypothetical protein